MPTKNSKTKLTDRQDRFCREYIIDYNSTDAAIRAGYSQKTAYSIGSENLKKPEVLARVRELQAQQAERLAISADWVILQLVEVYKKCMQVEEVMIWDGGERKKVPSGEYVFDSKGALSALEMIGKHLAMFEGRGKSANDKTLQKLDEILGGINSAF